LLKRQVLEKYQILVYLAAIACGLTVGIFMPGRTGALEAVLWPVLALLLYSTFTQVPLVHLRQVISDTRFVKSAVIGNFMLVPVLVWILLQFLPSNPAIRLGVLLVLLVPCTDWFITFTHLGGGDTKHAIAFSPISLLLQIVLLPFYLWLFIGETFAVTVARREMVAAFVGLIVLPLLGAFVTEKWLERAARRVKLLDFLAWLPVPLLGLVVFIIAATQVNLVTASLGILGHLLLAFVGYLVVAALLARVLAQIFGLPTLQGRGLAFSLGTRNSFVVLPLALALPPSYDLAVVAIVFQSLVELLGMVVYLWWVPTILFPQSGE
jgi:arsenite transporter